MGRVESHRYLVVDVFTTEALAGNPLAVFPHAGELSATLMQKIARELNLAETAFVLPATAQGLCGTRAHLYAREGDGIRWASDNWHCVCALAPRNGLAQHEWVQPGRGGRPRRDSN